MAGSTWGEVFRISTWGESHGKGLGVVVDGCPAGLALCEEDVQRYLDRRKPGQSRFTTKRSESDTVEILSGVFEGRTTGTPISMLVRNQDQHSKDYSEIASYYRPGHADYTFDEKYGFRDYRGGGRSSGRETIGRVAAGAIAAKLLESLNIRVKAYTKAIGPVEVAPDRFDLAECEKNTVLKCIEALKLQKPKLFSPRKHKKEFRQQSKEYSDQLQIAIVKENKIRIELLGLQDKIKKFQTEIDIIKRKSEQDQIIFDTWEENKKSEIHNLEAEVENLEERLKSIEINELNLELDYEELQLSNPWFDIKYRRLQSQLFIKALEVRKQFLYENRKNIKAAYIIWNKQSEYLEKKHIISEAWNWINMTIPVIGSTFASFSRMCANMGKETIGHLFIDEAGQALPQASVGAIFRSRYVMAVGDPAQIKPVLTLDSNILNMLGEYYGVSRQYLSETASTQTLVDAISKYGFYKDTNKEDWIGIPLWVHRRCKYPMFDISNKISYSGNMVQGEKSDGIAEWYDIKGHAIDKYVAEQGEFLRKKLQSMIMKNPNIVNKQSDNIVYVISPFKNVAYQLSQELKKIGFTRYDKNGKPTNVGTVHTFQGKEAPIVFLVLGADEKCIGAANWAMGTENPNIMNVAATRAKNEFYIIGDKKMYLSLNSDVINNTYEIIKKHMI